MSNEEKIEVIKWHQRIQEIAYIEAGQHMRALNQLMWQVPSFVIAINGGLWYGTTLVSELAAKAIFLMVFIFDLLSIVTLYRLRALLELKIKFQSNVEEQCLDTILSEGSLYHFNDIYLRNCLFVKKEQKTRDLAVSENKSWLSMFFLFFYGFINRHSNGKYTVIGCWTIVLLFCAFISLVGCCSPNTFLDKADKTIKYEVKNLKNGDTITVIKQ